MGEEQEKPKWHRIKIRNKYKKDESILFIPEDHAEFNLDIDEKEYFIDEKEYIMSGVKGKG